MIDTTELRACIRHNHQRLVEALGSEPVRGRTGGPTPIDPDVADQAAAGRLYFNHAGQGRTPTEVGLSDIDWSGPQHNHQEWRAQLNRFFQLPALAARWRQTGEDRHVEAARAYLVDWLDAHPAHDGDPWALARYDNTLNLAIRVGNWLGALATFVDDEARFDDALLERIIHSVAAQLRYLSDHLADRMNWRIAHADALLMAGLRLDPAADSAAWREVGVRTLNDAFFRQVLPDGAHSERNPSYHGWMTRVFETYWRLGRAMPELGLSMRAETIATMHDYGVGTTRPNGDFNAMHDCVGKRTGALDDTKLRARAAFRAEAGLPETDPPTIQFFPHAGQAFLRDGWGDDATYLTFDATTWGGGHCHLSRNTVQLYAHGRALLVDPGTLTYESSDPLSAHGKSTRAHNTVNFNGMNQAFTNPTRTRHASADGYELVSSLYAGGYWPNACRWGFDDGLGHGLYGEHHRTLIWAKGRFTLVVDHVYNGAGSNDKPTIECNWQLSDGPVHVAPDGTRAVTGHDDANLLMLFAVQPEGTQLTVHEGEQDPPAGWLPGTGGGYQPAPQLRQSAPQRTERDLAFATVLVPFAGQEAPTAVVEHAQAPEVDGCGRLALTWGDGSRDEFWWTGRQEIAINTRDGLTSDAGLIHLRRDANREVIGGLVVDGTHLDPVLTTRRDTPSIFAL